jgi:predicted AAA+ superfamily ATPase
MSSTRACDTALRWGSYPGSIEYLNDPLRWAAYVREAVIEPALSRDIRDIGPVRKPALLRQVFWVAASSPAQVVALKRLQGRLEDAGSLETIATYLDLLERAYLVAHIDKFSTRAARRRAAPPKLVTLNQALLAVADPLGPPTAAQDSERLGRWIENAVMAHAWNRGQRVRYWREEPFEVDMVLDGSWGSFAVEVKSGRYAQSDLAGLLEFTRRHARYEPLFVGVAGGLGLAERLGVRALTWQDFLLHGPGGKAATADAVRGTSPRYRVRKKKVSAGRTRRSRPSR